MMAMMDHDKGKHQDCILISGAINVNSKRRSLPVQCVNDRRQTNLACSGSYGTIVMT